MKIIKIVLIAAVAVYAFIGFAPPAKAYGSASNGFISKIELGPLHSGLVLLTVTGVSGQPGCQSGPYSFVFDVTAVGGKETLAAALMLKASQQPISISGNGVCNLYSGVEDLRWLRAE